MLHAPKSLHPLTICLDSRQFIGQFNMSQSPKLLSHELQKYFIIIIIKTNRNDCREGATKPSGETL